MVDARNKFAQPDKDAPFGRHLKEVTRYLNIGIPSFTGTYIATLPEEQRWMIQVQVLGRTFTRVTKPIEFSFDAPTWSLGKSMAAHITMEHIGEVFHKELKDTIYQICGHRDEQWEMISIRKDRSVATFIQELNQHILLGNVAQIQNFPTCHHDLSMESSSNEEGVDLHTLVDRARKCSRERG